MQSTMIMRRTSFPRLRILALLSASVAVASCVGPDAQRTRADRATYDWFAPMFRVYVQRDVILDEAAKATHLRGLDAWNARIAADEAAIGGR